MRVLQIDDTVERDTKESGYCGRKGKILVIEGNRARVKWEKNTTWYKLDRLKLSQ